VNPFILANSSRRETNVPATSRPKRPAISAHVPTRAKPAIVSSPKQEDLKWLTTTSRNLRRTGRTVFRTTRGRALGGWGLSLLASLSYSSCFTPSSGALLSRLNKTQAPSHQRLKQHQHLRNNNTHSRQIITGRGAIPVLKAVRTLYLPPHFKLGGSNASALEVRPC
jgi:hypothetical protein